MAEQVTLLVHGADGLKSALNATKALYEGSVAGLGELRAEEIANLFQGATIVELLPEPGQSILEVAMKIGCFPTTSKKQIFNFSVWLTSVVSVFYRRCSENNCGRWILYKSTKGYKSLRSIKFKYT